MQDLRGPNDVGEGRLFRIEVDDAPVGQLERTHTTRPQVERNGAKVGDIDHRVLVIGHEVADLPLRVFAPDADGAKPVRGELRRIFLIEHLPVDAVRVPRHYDWTVSQIWQDPGRDRAVVV